MIDTGIAEERLQRNIEAALAGNPYIPLNRIQFEARGGDVTLEGDVASYFQKQMAQETIRRLDGVERIDNLLQVNWS